MSLRTHKKPLNQKGFGLLEVAIGATIISVALLVLLSTYGSDVKGALGNESSIKAAYLAEEGVEAVKLLRDGGWNLNLATLVPGTNYYLSWGGSSWSTTLVPQYVDGFERSFVVSSVYRDANSDITTSGSIDANTLKLVVSVAWSIHGATTTKSVSTYVTNLFGN